LLAAIGEPVRAMASGRVEFAGVDSRTHGALELAPDRLANVPPDRMGARGLFVRIDHGRDIDTLYVHLSEYVVTTGERVQRGELLGYVGRTGVHTSDAHLHLGLFNGDSVVDPLPHLQPLFLSGDDIPVVDYTTAP
jgi:murein DD-endopeptidase MepM/ murein hydrolase activator NlpD